MQCHEKYGREIARYRSKSARVYLAMTGLVILLLVVLAIAAFMLVDPNFWGFARGDTVGTILPAGLIVICLIWAFYLIPKVPKALHREGVLYENGVVLSLQQGANRRSLACGFDEIKGIRRYTVRVWTAGVIPSKKFVRFIVVLKDKYQIYTGNSPIKAASMNRSEYNLTRMYPVGFLENFFERYTNYLIRDLTRENVMRAEMTFGPDLELNNGKFVYMGGQVVLPLSDVSRVTSDRWPFMSSKINLRSVNENEKEKKIISIPIDQVMNLDALYYIINELT